MDFNKELISIVSHYKPLYELNSKKTKSEEEAMWCEIAARLEKDVVQCQTRWRTLRTAFGKHHKQIMLSKMDESRRPPRPWVYYKSLLFLLNHVKHRERRITTRKRVDKSLDEGGVSEPSSVSDHNGELPANLGHSLIYDPANLKTDFATDEESDSVPQLDTPAISPNYNPRKRKSDVHPLMNGKVPNSRDWRSYNEVGYKQPSTTQSPVQATPQRSSEWDNVDHFGMFIAAQLKTKPRAVVENYMKRITDVLFSNVLVEVTISEQQANGS